MSTTAHRAGFDPETPPQRLPKETSESLLVTVLVHSEDATWWADSPELPGLVIADIDRNALIDAIGPAVDYYVEETPSLRGRLLDLRIVDEAPSSHDCP